MTTQNIDFNPIPFTCLGGLLGIGIAAGLGLWGGKQEEEETLPISIPKPELVLPDWHKVVESVANEDSLSTAERPKTKEDVKPEPEGKVYEPDLSDLETEPAVLLYGAQGSGKSSKAGYLVTRHLDSGHNVEVINPFNKNGQYHPLKVWGAGEDFADATEGLKNFSATAAARLKRRGISEYNPFKDTRLLLILEEVTNWESKISSQVMGDFLEVCIQKLRQANMSVVIVSHWKNVTCLGGKSAGSGKTDAIMNQFLRLQCQAKKDPNVPGGKSCAGWAYLEWNSGGGELRKRVTIPDYILPPNDDYDYSGLVTQDSKFVENIAIQEEEKVEEENKDPGLPEHMRVLLDFCRQCFLKTQKPVKARDVQRSNWTSIKAQKLDPYAIRIAFQLLANRGYGTIRGENESLAFLPNLVDYLSPATDETIVNP